MFEGFATRRIVTSGGSMIHVVIGGVGPPLLLLHGYPQTHVMWHKIAPRLAEEFTVVAPDLRGYGDSDKPDGGPDHSGYGKRTMASDQAEVMTALGFPRFALVGHDRGARVSYRMALDHADRVTQLAVLDIVPTYETWIRMNHQLGLSTYHWLFLAQPFDLPERLIGGDPEYFLSTMLSRWSGADEAITAEAMAEYRRCFSDPATIHATCEDYRAGATIDFAHDEADRGRRKIACPMLALWGAGRRRRPGLDYLAVWREWAHDVRGAALPCGHFLPEEAPDQTYAALRQFLMG
jgi:haloacetate dehalogenase